MNALEIVYGIIGFGAVASVVSSFAAHIVLQFYIDHARVREETGEPGWKIFGSMLATADFYRPEAAWLWKVRRVGFIGFFVAGGLIVLTALVAAALAGHIA